MAMVHNGCVYTANVGDSGACLGRLGPNGRIQAVEISKYARPSDPQVNASSPQCTFKQTILQAEALFVCVSQLCCWPISIPQEVQDRMYWVSSDETDMYGGYCLISQHLLLSSICNVHAILA